MPAGSATAHVATDGGVLLVLVLMLPVAGLLAIIATGGRLAGRIGVVTLGLGLLTAIGIAVEVHNAGDALTYLLGGWQPPLGLALRADGLAAVMILMTALVVTATGLYAGAQQQTDGELGTPRKGEMFWVLLLGTWAALNAVYLGEDLFNLYVALELLTFAAVPLVSLDGRAGTVEAALRYLLFAVLGSMLYLLGTALIYSAYGTLDIRELSRIASPGHALSGALALMIVGLLAKAALFPLHLWLPPAHAGAPAAASAVLSALVVKAPFFLVLRLVFEVAPQGSMWIVSHLLAVLGGTAIIFCSLMALRQGRLKLMIAYSTLAQIGYLFLVFPLASGVEGTPPWGTIAWTGGILQLVSHAFAKSAMFLAAGCIYAAFGHDRIADLRGFGHALPISTCAFALAGLSLVGLPPGGGFTAKCSILTAAVAASSWWIVATILIGGLIAAGYVFRVIGGALATPTIEVSANPVPRRLEVVSLGLAVIAVLLGFLPLEPAPFLELGHVARVGAR